MSCSGIFFGSDFLGHQEDGVLISSISVFPQGYEVSQGPWHSCLRKESSHSSLSLRLLERHLETRVISHQKCQFLSLSKIIKFKALLLRLAHLGLLLDAGDQSQVKRCSVSCLSLHGSNLLGTSQGYR